MNISIKLNSSEIVHRVVHYTRTLDICSGQGTLTLDMDYESALTIDPWDIIEIYEDGNKVGLYYVIDFSKTATTGIRTITAQDGSKKLMDYFVPDVYTLSYPTMTRYWIERFLTDAGVSYSINVVGNGQVLSENSSLGPSSAYDLIMGLLQQSGWYMYFDANGVCQIGTLTKDLSDAMETLTDDIILSIQVNKSDKSLRNRAVVWGNYSAGSWAFADISTKTGYETNALDSRPVVLANSTIYSSGTAATLAKKLLNEFANISVEKIVELAGYYDLTVGDVVYVDSEFYTGSCLITNLQVDASPKSGCITTLTLDVKCPRLFAYYGFITWVYTGTDGQGVWRKRLDSAIWENFSTGLSSLVVTDLIIKNSLFACITGSGCYINTSHYAANWKKFSCGTLTDSAGIEYLESKVEPLAVAIDDSTNEILIVYSLTEAESGILGYQRSWIVKTNGKRLVLKTYPVILATNSEVNLTGIDVEKYSKRDLVSVTAGGGIPPDPSLDSTWGYKRTHPLGIRDDESNIYSVAEGLGTTYSGTSIIAGPSFANNVSQDTTFYGRTSISFDPSHFQYTAWSGDTPFTLSVPVPAFTLPAGGYSYDDLAVYWKNELDSTGEVRAEEDRHYVVTFLYHDFSPSDLRTTVKEYTPVLSGFPYRLPDVSAASDINLGLSGEITIDGVSVLDGNRVLVAAQTDATENGTYIVHGGPWERTSDILDRCATIVVTSGTNYAISAWQVVTDDPIIDVTEIDIQRVLIPNTVVNNYSIASGAGVSLLSYDNYLTTINGVIYLFVMLRSALTFPRTVTFYIFKYNCETGAYSTNSVMSNTENYESTWFYYWSTAPCGTGVCQMFVERKLAKTGATIEDAIIEANEHLKIMIIKHTATSTSIYTDTVATATYQSWYGDTFGCYKLIHDWDSRGTQPVHIRYQGNIISNGLYYPYFKVRLKLSKIEGKRDYNVTTADCLEDCDVIDTTTDSYSSDEWLLVRVYDAYNNSLVVNENTYKTYSFEVTGSKADCFGNTADAWSWIEFSDNLDMAEYNGWLTESDVNVPIYSETSYPIFVIDATTVMKGNTKSTVLATLTNTNKVVSQIADDRGFLYIADPAIKKVYKEHHTGGIDATFILPTIPTYQDNFAYTNQLFIFDDGYDSTGYAIKYNPYNSQIYKLSDDIIVTFSGEATAYILERNKYDTFDIVDTDIYALNIESSMNWPLVSRTIGEPLGTATGHHFRIYSSYPNYVEGSGYLQDARVTNIGGNFLEAPEEITQNKYGLIIPSGGSLYLASTLDANERTLLYTYSGAIVTESSNNYFPNYLFIASLSGFMQRFPTDESAFVDHSAGMPIQRINIIRLDDRI